MKGYEGFTRNNGSKRKKLILAFVIVNFLLLSCLAAVLCIMYGNITPEEEAARSFNLKPLVLIFAVFFWMLAFIELFFGIFTYKGKRWAAIALLCCEFISWIGVFGAVAAILQLAKPDKNTVQS